MGDRVGHPCQHPTHGDHHCSLHHQEGQEDSKDEVNLLNNLHNNCNLTELL